MPCVYLPGPAPAVTVANNYRFRQDHSIRVGPYTFFYMAPILKIMYAAFRAFL